MIFLFAALGNVYAQAPTQPTLPQKTVSLTLPMQGTPTCPTLTTGSNCIRNVPSGNATSFQNAINAATCGDTIVLVAGSTYSGNFTIPSTACSGWIVIQSSALGSLPPPGTRISPSNLSNMAVISTPNTSAAVQFNPSSNHWRLIGLDITTSYMSTVNVVYYLVATGESQTNQSLLPSYIIFDRDLILGLSTTNTQHGIGMNAASIGIVDSYCDEIHAAGYDSQCLFVYNSPGPFLIQNNFIQAAGENIIFGGADPAIANLVPSDITIVGNLIQKNTAWHGQAAPYNWTVKNLVEFKNAQRVLVDGNVIQNVWTAGQNGMAILLTPRNQSGTCSWCVVQDVTWTHNIVQHTGGGIGMAGSDDAYPSLPAARVLVQNNLFNDVSSAAGTGFGIQFPMASAVPHAHDITIDHNTVFANHHAMDFGDSGTADYIQITNNLFTLGTYGISGSGYGEGTPSLNHYTTNLTYKDILLIAATANPNGATYPSGTLWSTQTNVGFTSISGTPPNFSGKFQLTSSSAYHNAGTDGRDIGVWDWTCLNNDSAAALAGKFVPSPGCALSGTLLLQPPTNVTAVIR